MISLPSWKQTALGTPIELYASEPLENLRAKKPIVLIGGVHGDEPEGVRLAQDTLSWLKSNTDADKQLCPWVLIPCLNVDGFAKKTRVNGRGVDLNRNYPSRDWTSEAKAERYFPGTSPGSEPEVQGIVELIENLRPRLIVHCHSWKPMIVGTGGASKKDTLRLSRSSGYEAVDEIGYPTPGSLSRYGWHDRRVPIICIEEQEGLEDLSSIWPRFESSMKEIFFDLDERSPLPFDHLVFDLDDTILDTSRQLIPKAAKEACEAMIHAGLECDLKSCLEARETFLRSEWRSSARSEVYAYLVERFGVKTGADRSVAEKRGYEAFHNREVEPNIALLPGVREMLHDLRAKYSLHLVTQGHESTQKTKIAFLGLENAFDSIHVVDTAKGQTKGDAFKDIMAKTGDAPTRFLSIGNRLDTDIGEAKKFGWYGCWVRYGEHAGTRPAKDFENPDFTIASVEELVYTCRL